MIRHGLALGMVIGCSAISLASAQIRVNGKPVANQPANMQPGQGGAGQHHIVSTPAAPPVTVGQDGVVAMRKSYCREVARHQPSADVAHWPAADPNLVPADIEPPMQVDTTRLTIPLNIPVSEYLGNPSRYNVPLTNETQVAVGLLALDERGGLMLNGEPLNLSAEETAVLCGSEQ